MYVSNTRKFWQEIQRSGVLSLRKIGTDTRLQVLKNITEVPYAETDELNDLFEEDFDEMVTDFLMFLGTYLSFLFLSLSFFSFFFFFFFFFFFVTYVS